MNINKIRGFMCPFKPGRILNDDCHKCIWFNIEKNSCEAYE